MGNIDFCDGETIMIYKDFKEAGVRLAETMQDMHFENPLILAVVWGGVEIGGEVSRKLGIPLDIIKPLKISAPGNPGVLIGAVAGAHEVYIDEELVGELDISGEYLTKEIENRKTEIAELEKYFREGFPPKSLTGRTLIIADDGIATGATMIAAIKALRKAKPLSVVVAAPVANPESLKKIREAADDVICLQSPEDFSTVEGFYEKFIPTGREKIKEILSGSQLNTLNNQDLKTSS
jgi:predicted phosphoribosyltransferase